MSPILTDMDLTSSVSSSSSSISSSSSNSASSGENGGEYVDSEENAAIYVCVVIFFYGMAIVSLIGLNMKSTENARQRRGDNKVSFQAASV